MRELHLAFTVIVPDDADTAPVLRHLAGREFPGIPGSWIVRADPSADSTADGAEPQPVPAGTQEGPSVVATGSNERAASAVVSAHDARWIRHEAGDDDIDDFDRDPHDMDPGDFDRD